MAKLEELVTRRELLSPGHSFCAGCGAPVAVRQILLALPPEAQAVVCCATGCLEVSTTIYPLTNWRCSFVHNAFENAAATLSGARAMYDVMQRKGKVNEDFRFIAFGGDGGTYDIGFQSLSGAMERGHRIIYACYNNEAYMNTGIQRSGATPRGAWTTTSLAGKAAAGKPQVAKDLTAIMAEHNLPYVAQASISHWRDLVSKAEKAWEYSKEGPVFLNVLAPCHRGWRFPMEKSIEVARLAVRSRFWPLYEVEQGEWHLTNKVANPTSVLDWMKMQGRFAHLFKGEGNQEILDQIVSDVERNWNKLMRLCSPEVA